MADYNKQTVAQLRQLLKDRGIPSTGLTRKAQIVEKLEEADSADAGAPKASDAPTDAATDAQEPEGAEAQSAQEDPVVPGPPLEEAGGMSIYFAEQAHVLMPPRTRSNSRRNACGSRAHARTCAHRRPLARDSLTHRQ